MKLENYNEDEFSFNSKTFGMTVISSSPQTLSPHAI